MTRLIDADAIKNLEWISERGMADCGEEFVYMSAINKMPTVDAIPFSWLENFRNSLESNREEWLKLAISFLIIAYSVEMEKE